MDQAHTHRDGADDGDVDRSPGVGPYRPAPGVTTLMQPVAEGERIASLDVLRGVAIMGIQFVNMQLFAMPFASAMGTELSAAPWAERLAWAFVRTFFEYKFITMFSLLFGAGLIVQMMRASHTNRDFTTFTIRRFSVLAAFGVVHFTLLWYGDILFLYALFAVPLVMMRRLPARSMVTIAAGCLMLSATLGLGCGTLQLQSQAQRDAADVGAGVVDQAARDRPGEIAHAEQVEASGARSTTDEPAPTGFAAIGASHADPMHPTWINAERTAYAEGPFVDAFAFRIVSYTFAALFSFFGYGWHVLAMFLLGAALMKLDFFRADQLCRQRRMALWGFGVGLPAEGLVTVVTLANEHRVDGIWLLTNVFREFSSVALCLGYVGLTCLVVNKGWLRAASFGLSRVGRMALSAYLIETVAATFFMYWWGLGWFDSVSRVQQLGLVVAILAGIVVFCVMWMRFFRMGPVEWLWRSLTYGRVQRLRRTPHAA